ncbi:hypothetical protein AB8O53_01870 [Streptomyces pilosus]
MSSGAGCWRTPLDSPPPSSSSPVSAGRKGSYFLRPADRWLRRSDRAVEEEAFWASRCLDDSVD